MILSPALPATRTRTHRCPDCLRPLPATSPRICPNCVERRERAAVADQYRLAICAMTKDREARWSIDHMLFRLIGHAGFSAPIVLQAIADRAAWLSPITYPGVCEIAREEAAALGLDIQVA